MRWFILFLLVANVALFFWLQQQSRPAPGSSAVPPPDIGSLRLRHEQGIQEAATTDALAAEVHRQVEKIPSGSVAELRQNENMPAVSSVSTADPGAGVESVSDLLGPHAKQRLQRPDRAAGPPAPSPRVSGGLVPLAQVRSPESSPGDPADPLPSREAGSNPLSPAKQAESADPLPEAPTGPSESLPDASAASTVPAPRGTEASLLPENLAPSDRAGQEGAGFTQRSAQEQAATFATGRLQGPLEPAAGSQALTESVDDASEVSGAMLSVTESDQPELPVPYPSEARPAVCVRVGPLMPQDAESLVVTLPAHVTLLSDVAEEYTDVTGYYVLIPPLASRTDGIRKLGELRDAGVNDIWLFRSGEFNNAISLGLFSREKTARRHAANIEKKGFVSEIRERTSIKERRWLELQHADGIDLPAEVSLPDGATVEPLPCPGSDDDR